MSFELAKKTISDNSKVLYGIFGVIESSGYFPPFEFLNEFLMQGEDPCDQDGRMKSWKPFLLDEAEYSLIKNWWLSNHNEAIVNDLGASNWAGWANEIIEMV